MNLISKLETLRAREHEATVEIVRKLVECDRTGAHLECGYGSIWDFLVRHLKYSNAAASRRYKAMKAAKRDPRVLAMLAKHQINLSALAMVEASLERDPGLLAEIAGKSQRQVEQILARRNPHEKRRERVQRIAVKKGPGLLEAHGSAAEVESRGAAASSAAKVKGCDAGASSAAEVNDRDATSSAAEVEDRVALSFDVSAATHQDIERAKAILSRKYPDGVTLERLMNELLGRFLQAHEPKGKPRRDSRKSQERQAPTRHVPKATRDEVFERDGHRCAYTGPDGIRCDSRHDLELDHIRPWAIGGGHEPDNLRVLCAKHNRLQAEKTFGTLPLRKCERARSGSGVPTGVATNS